MKLTCFVGHYTWDYKKKVFEYYKLLLSLLLNIAHEIRLVSRKRKWGLEKQTQKKPSFQCQGLKNKKIKKSYLVRMGTNSGSNLSREKVIKMSCADKKSRHMAPHTARKAWINLYMGNVIKLLENGLK